MWQVFRAVSCVSTSSHHIPGHSQGPLPAGYSFLSLSISKQEKPHYIVIKARPLNEWNWCCNVIIHVGPVGHVLVNRCLSLVCYTSIFVLSWRECVWPLVTCHLLLINWLFPLSMATAIKSSMIRLNCHNHSLTWLWTHHVLAYSRRMLKRKWYISCVTVIVSTVTEVVWYWSFSGCLFVI